MDTKAESLRFFIKKEASVFQFFLLILFPFLIVSGDKLSLPLSVVLYIYFIQAIGDFQNPPQHFLWEYVLAEVVSIIAILGFFFLFIYLFIKPKTKIGDRFSIGSVLALYPPFVWTVVRAIQHPKTMAFVLDAIFLLLSIITLYGLASRVKDHA